jgi:hypothetical protein
MATKQRHSIEQVARNVWKIVEDDPYGQYPFLYAILGTDKCVLIDTGCGKQTQTSNTPPSLGIALHYAVCSHTTHTNTHTQQQRHGQLSRVCHAARQQKEAAVRGD